AEPPQVDVPVAVAADGGPDQRFTVRLRREPVGAPLLGGCDDTTPEQRYTWALAGLAEPTSASR
ncbi:MAG: hypothetical protein ACODAF_08585, partial [Actinomycetota bacterium]